MTDETHRRYHSGRYGATEEQKKARKQAQKTTDAIASATKTTTELREQRKIQESEMDPLEREEARQRRRQANIEASRKKK